MSRGRMRSMMGCCASGKRHPCNNSTGSPWPLNQRFLIGLQELYCIFAPPAYVNCAAQYNRLVRGQVAYAICWQHICTQTCLTKYLSNFLCNLCRCTILGGVGY